MRIVRDRENEYWAQGASGYWHLASSPESASSYAKKYGSNGYGDSWEHISQYGPLVDVDENGNDLEPSAELKDGDKVVVTLIGIWDDNDLKVNIGNEFTWFNGFRLREAGAKFVRTEKVRADAKDLPIGTIVKYIDDRYVKVDINSWMYMSSYGTRTYADSDVDGWDYETIHRPA